MTKIAFDPVLMKVGCVIVQAAMGGDAYLVGTRFPSQTWAVVPTPNMSLFEVTPRQVEKLLAKLQRRRDEERRYREQE